MEITQTGLLMGGKLIHMVENRQKHGVDKTLSTGSLSSGLAGIKKYTRSKNKNLFTVGDIDE